MDERVAVFTDDPGWHGERLRQALAARGLGCVYIPPQECRIDLETRHGLVLPGFERELPAAVFVRGVPGGTLEQVVLRLDFLHCLAELGVPVCNSARAVERTVDKAMTSFLLWKAGIATPAAWVTEAQPQARSLLMRETAAGRQLVLKPLFGSRGKGLRRIRKCGDLPPGEEYSGVYYLQRFVGSGQRRWRDWRVFVIGGRAVGAMMRIGRHWITNVAQGAVCESADADGEMGRLAVAATEALGMDYAGVDILADADGVLAVGEVNGIPAWKALQGVCPVDIAQRLVDELILPRVTGPRAQVA